MVQDECDVTGVMPSSHRGRALPRDATSGKAADPTLTGNLGKSLEPALKWEDSPGG